MSDTKITQKDLDAILKLVESAERHPPDFYTPPRGPGGAR